MFFTVTEASAVEPICSVKATVVGLIERTAAIPPEEEPLLALLALPDEPLLDPLLEDPLPVEPLLLDPLPVEPPLVEPLRRDELALIELLLLELLPPLEVAPGGWQRPVWQVCPAEQSASDLQPKRVWFAGCG
jgi:hypothetical protein